MVHHDSKLNVPEKVDSKIAKEINKTKSRELVISKIRRVFTSNDGIERLVYLPDLGGLKVAFPDQWIPNRLLV